MKIIYRELNKDVRKVYDFQALFLCDHQHYYLSPLYIYVEHYLKKNNLKAVLRITFYRMLSEVFGMLSGWYTYLGVVCGLRFLVYCLVGTLT